MDNESIELRSRFMSFAMLQGLGRLITHKALPCRDLAKDKSIRCFGELTLKRIVQNVKGISDISIIDATTYEHYECPKPPDGIPHKLGDASGWWAEVASGIIAKNPTKGLMMFYDTIMLMDTEPARIEKTFEKFKSLFNEPEIIDKGKRYENPLDWLCDNGGKKVNVATLMTIEGVLSQMIFTHDSVINYRDANDFREISGLLDKIATKLIDKNMAWLEKLQLSHIDTRDELLQLIHRHINDGFVWFDNLHSQPLMEATQHFGFGDRDDIEAKIGKALIDTLGDAEGN